eukprot:736276-Heterocapsa_arctica.AAC.1
MHLKRRFLPPPRSSWLKGLERQNQSRSSRRLAAATRCASDGPPTQARSSDSRQRPFGGTQLEKREIAA